MAAEGPPPAVEPPSIVAAAGGAGAPPEPAPLGRSPYPFAYAPDIIRSHQKDAYFQGVLTHQIADLHRRLLGARSAHAWAAESRTVADLLYLSLTTLLGNRTLGEEYCGLVQVEAETGALPALRRRAGYIAGSILLPYGVGKVLPSLRSRLRKMLEGNLARARSRYQEQQQHKQHSRSSSSSATPPESTRSYRLQSYILANLSSITSPAPIQAVSLALFYFSGSYYEISKRLSGLRYIFTHKIGESSQRAGYEVLGVLLVAQMLIQSFLHVRENLVSSSSSSSARGERGNINHVHSNNSLNVSLEEHAYSSNNELLLQQQQGGSLSMSGDELRLQRVLAATSTPALPAGSEARVDLGSDPEAFAWIREGQQRKCTLCLEELKDPSATSCGHIFCWACIGPWLRESAQCPLCRREALVQHILPLRAC